MKCLECGGKMRKTKTNHRYIESGLDNIVLIDATAYKCQDCDEDEIEIPRADKLHLFIAFLLSLKPTSLTGAEARFLRKHLGYTAAELASAMGITRLTVTRWENAKGIMKEDRDKHLRLFYLEKKGDAINRLPELKSFFVKLQSFLPMKKKPGDVKIHADDWMPVHA